MRTGIEPRNIKKPHGDVPYADPGYLDADGEQVSKSGNEGVARYPVDEEHVQAAWSYINQEKNASQYTAEQLSAIKGRIKSAMKKFGKPPRSLTPFRCLDSPRHRRNQPLQG